MNYILDCIHTLQAKGLRSIEVRPTRNVPTLQ